jgi:ribose transport system permease protein
MSDSGGVPAGAPGAGAIPAAALVARRRRRIPESAALVVFLLAEVIFFWIKSPVFFSWDNFLNILTAISVIGIVAVPGTILLIAGQFDLSVGSAVAFCGVVMAHYATDGDIRTGVLLAILAGIGVGIVNGFFVTVIGVNAIITTLATLAIFRGLAEVVSDGQSISVSGFDSLGTNRPFLDIPVPVILLAVVAIGLYLVMRYTVFGRSMYAIGANPVAARLVGVRSKRALMLAFVLSGTAAALGGLILVSQLGSASPLTATGLELSVVTAVILGGASLNGGRGTIQGTIVGLLIIGVLNNGLVLLGVDPFWQDVARGVLLAAAVSFDQLRIRLGGE